MNLQEFISPLIGLYGKPTIARECGVAYNTFTNGWLKKGFPMTEASGETRYIDAIVALAQKSDATRHITKSSLIKYINNPQKE